MILKIFEAGEYPQGSWPLERVRAMVDAYDPVGNIEAPGVVGHMDNVLAERLENELAYAWVKSLTMNEQGEVFADVPDDQMSPELRSWLANHNLRYISAEIAEYDKQPAPTPPYLIRIAFLGRSTPAVSTTRIPGLFRKLLSVVGFGKADSEAETGASIVRFCRKIDEVALASVAHPTKADTDSTNNSHTVATAAPTAAFGAQPKSSDEEGSMTEKELQDENAQLKAANDGLRTRVSAFEQAEAEGKTRAAKEDAERFFGGLRDSGKIAPAQFDKAVATDLKLEGEARASFRALFEAEKPKTMLSAFHVANRETARSEQPLSGSLVQEIKAFAREEKIDFEEAAKRLHVKRPELFGEEA